MANTMPAVDWRILPPFLELIGVQDLLVEQGSAEVSLIFDPSRHANGIGVAHGGVICTLLDVVMGYSAFHSGDQPSPYRHCRAERAVCRCAQRARASNRKGEPRWTLSGFLQRRDSQRCWKISRQRSGHFPKSRTYLREICRLSRS